MFLWPLKEVKEIAQITSEAASRGPAADQALKLRALGVHIAGAERKDVPNALHTVILQFLVVVLQFFLKETTREWLHEKEKFLAPLRENLVGQRERMIG